VSKFVEDLENRTERSNDFQRATRKHVQRKRLTKKNIVPLNILR